MKKFIFIFLLSFFISFWPQSMILAAEIFFEQVKDTGLQSQLMTSVFINTEEALNAVEGKVIFPSELLELKEIKDGNSIVNFWLERPVAGKAGEITFSGVTPGGYKGAKRLIFSMIFWVKQEGEGIFQTRDARALLNDGEGTEANLKTLDLRFTAPKKEPVIKEPALEAKDKARPETFTPEVGRDPAILDGKWFVVFAARDKDSGVAHYEIKETRYRTLGLFSKWISAESPFALRDQKLRSYIFVKAVDKAGNKRVIKIAPWDPMPWYENYENWAIIIIVTLAALPAAKKLWRKKRA